MPYDRSAPLARRLHLMEEDNLVSDEAQLAISAILDMCGKTASRCHHYVCSSDGTSWRATCTLERSHNGDHLYRMDRP